MGAAFQQLAAVARRAVEAVHGESVTVQPMRQHGPSGRPVADGARQSFVTVACFYEESDPGRMEILRPVSLDRPSLNRAPALTASIRLAADCPLRTGDRVLRGDATFEILSIDPDGTGTAMIGLARAQHAGG